MFLRGMYAFEEEQTCSLLLSRLHARSRASVVLAVVAQSAVFARRVGSLGHIVLEGNRLFVSALPLHRTDHKLLTMWLIRRITCLTINNIF